ncbi:hypothetical protein AB4Y89_18445 [Terriglobus sp. 2YAB30_2]|uniref:hypothetical protein n=1 Tax=Terriglobus sp. 2YAB30_2 TaxID=3233023 RepID=UPI003F9C4D27
MLYFGSGRPGGFGKDDIYRARQTPNGTWLEHFPCRCSPGHPHLWAFSAMKTPLHAPFGIPSNRENALENAGPGLNTADAEYEFLPPNGQWGLRAIDKGIYRVEHTAKGWQRTGLLSKEINATGTEIGAMFIGRDGSFIFSRDTGKEKSGEFFLSTPNEIKAPGKPPRLTKNCTATLTHHNQILGAPR